MPLYKLLNHLIILNFLWSFGDYYNKISDYDIFYGDPHNLETTDKFLTYELITPLFSDYAFKHRAIYIPKNQEIKYYNELVNNRSCHTDNSLLFSEKVENLIFQMQVN